MLSNEVNNVEFPIDSAKAYFFDMAQFPSWAAMLPSAADTPEVLNVIPWVEGVSCGLCWLASAEHTVDQVSTEEKLELEDIVEYEAEDINQWLEEGAHVT